MTENRRIIFSIFDYLIKKFIASEEELIKDLMTDVIFNSVAVSWDSILFYQEAPSHNLAETR